MRCTRIGALRPVIGLALVAVLGVATGASCRRETRESPARRAPETDRPVNEKTYCLRVIRGPSEAISDDPAVDFEVELRAPPGYSLGWLNDDGTFLSGGIRSGSPRGTLTLFPGTCFIPALRQDSTGRVEEAGSPGALLPEGEPLPPGRAQDPVPEGPYWQRIRIVFNNFEGSPEATLDARLPNDPVLREVYPSNGFDIQSRGSPRNH